jgi:phage anti-repressor protein
LELAQDLYHSAEQFPVDFDLGWQWLGYTRKDSAKKKLLNHFKEGEDFILQQTAEPTPAGGYSNRENIKLTVNCFKEMGMMAGTEKGRDVRKYFLQCEEQLKLIATQQPQSTADMLLMFAQAFKEQEIRLAQVEAENAEIQHRLEAIDMETAANTAELERFSNGHGMWFSVAGWCNRHGIKKPVQWLNTQGRKAAAMCKQRGLKPVPVPDARFGQVNSYPDSILAELNWD